MARNDLKVWYEVLFFRSTTECGYGELSVVLMGGRGVSKNCAYSHWN